MSEKVQAALQDYEDKLTAGSIKTFNIKITALGLLLQSTPDGVVESQSILLSPDLHHSLQIFFSGIDAIEYGSFDYTTFKSLLNAHCTLERMANRTGNKERK
ncbi:hypothetical protein [Pontibacter cellulosilyticus]|uniref:Uncharacterized protein n=1 Tax=Pontibacter cellulosilyticus TaxID=1720253 RepID=A0A923N4Y9_9BACT|nr:hypothetical protein [Pontibacter cellulosilyticus]MBC5992254.1 hypothetical protein [Pontibacter cellulosilyticus]